MYLEYLHHLRTRKRTCNAYWGVLSLVLLNALAMLCSITFHAIVQHPHHVTSSLPSSLTIERLAMTCLLNARDLPICDVHCLNPDSLLLHLRCRELCRPFLTSSCSSCCWKRMPGTSQLSIHLRSIANTHHRLNVRMRHRVKLLELKLVVRLNVDVRPLVARRIAVIRRTKDSVAL